MRCPRFSPGEDSVCSHYIPSTNGKAGCCMLRSRFLCQEDESQFGRPLSFSSVRTYLQCRFKYYLRYILGYRLRPEHTPAPLALGKLWGLWLQHQYEPELVTSTHLKEHISETRMYLEDAARVRALTRAFRALGLRINKDEFLGCEYPVEYPVAGRTLIGYIDRAYEDEIVESKLSARPDFYGKLENVSSQVSTYLLANEKWDGVIMEVVRLPVLRTGKGKTANESPEAYEERCYQDILSRPTHYFPKFDRKKGTFGHRFWRSEFHLKEMAQIYISVVKDMENCMKENLWFPNELACHVPGPCEYLPFKSTGVFSEELYYKKGNEEEDFK